MNTLVLAAFLLAQPPKKDAPHLSHAYSSRIKRLRSQSDNCPDTSRWE